jgi:diketogulonate reductase-like aldo/keto reductase
MVAQATMPFARFGISMQRRPLGATGIEVPAVGLGTYRVFNVEGDADAARCEAVVDAAIAAGAGLIDTSPMYGQAERVVAGAIEGRRDAVVLTTKVWARTRAIGEEQIKAALEWFDRVDLYQVHNLLAFADHRPLLEALVGDGRVGAIGASHYLPSAIPELCTLIASGAVGAVQVPYHPGEKTIERELLPLAAEHGVGVIVMSPLGQGRLLDRAPDEAALLPLAPFGVTSWGQALLKWILGDPRVSCVIPATGRVDHMAENAAAGAPPHFGVHERLYVEELFAARG